MCWSSCICPSNTSNVSFKILIGSVGICFCSLILKYPSTNGSYKSHAVSSSRIFKSFGYPRSERIYMFFELAIGCFVNPSCSKLGPPNGLTFKSTISIPSLNRERFSLIRRLICLTSFS
ncbi:unknown [Bacillus thuringiensis phage MZTP02]|uniref:Uncharacterized protein n=1 Tax=Bacillus thuringiensis phage MZTP02 TaxID=311221 RepID=Q56AT0_9CAUD|nr:unknown [Bacillus thuringiensis phage MZTP02]